MTKRLFDILTSFVGLVLLSPLFLFISIWIKLDTPGPVFYRQIRVGRGNRDFWIFKFRTMYVGSDNGSPVTVGEHDSRITRSGYFLRKFKLDELPQLINVLKGDMSIVGPRPEVRHYVGYWTPEQLRILEIRPGITDPASIKFRNENELLGSVANSEEYYIKVIMQEKLNMYQEYMNNCGFWTDLSIIFNTFYAIIKKN